MATLNKYSVLFEIWKCFIIYYVFFLQDIKKEEMEGESMDEDDDDGRGAWNTVKNGKDKNLCEKRKNLKIFLIDKNR